MTPRPRCRNGEVKALEHEAGEETEDDYGERVRKRIGKEVSRRKALESERDQERAERERVQRERDEAMARLSKYEARQDEDLKSKADDLKTRRDKALDEGDLAEYNRLNDELMDTRIELRDRSTRRPAKADDEGGGEQQRQTQQPAASGAGSEWVARNKAWLQADEANVALAKGIGPSWCASTAATPMSYTVSCRSAWQRCLRTSLTTTETILVAILTSDRLAAPLSVFHVNHPTMGSSAVAAAGN